jgi:hypothetical protein
MIGKGWTFHQISSLPHFCRQVKISRGLERAILAHFISGPYWEVPADWLDRVYTIDCSTLYFYGTYTNLFTEYLFKVDTLNYELW